MRLFDLYQKYANVQICIYTDNEIREYPDLKSSCSCFACTARSLIFVISLKVVFFSLCKHNYENVVMQPSKLIAFIFVVNIKEQSVKEVIPRKHHDPLV